MIDAQAKEELVAQFRGYLDGLADEPAQGPSAENGGEADLFSLFTELAALNNEVRLESRQVKGALDQFRALFDTLEQTNQRLGRELDQAREAVAQAEQDAQRALLLGILDLRDRIEAGLESARVYRPGPLQRLGKRHRRFMQGLTEGMEITLRRLDELLARYQVRVVSAAGKPLDPYTMHAAAVEHRADQPGGMVLSELRKGFRWGEALLRPAEVIVNQTEESSP